MNALHAKVSELASCRRVDGRELCGGIWSSCLSLLATDTSCWLWWRLILWFVLLRVLLIFSIASSTARDVWVGLIRAHGEGGDGRVTGLRVQRMLYGGLQEGI